MITKLLAKPVSGSSEAPRKPGDVLHRVVVSKARGQERFYDNYGESKKGPDSSSCPVYNYLPPMSLWTLPSLGDNEDIPTTTSILGTSRSGRKSKAPIITRIIY
jgi:hypothetical protein